jgi:hypothetical protein
MNESHLFNNTNSTWTDNIQHGEILVPAGDSGLYMTQRTGFQQSSEPFEVTAGNSSLSLNPQAPLSQQLPQIQVENLSVTELMRNPHFRRLHARNAELSQRIIDQPAQLQVENLSATELMRNSHFCQLHARNAELSQRVIDLQQQLLSRPTETIFVRPPLSL